MLGDVFVVSSQMQPMSIVWFVFKRCGEQSRPQDDAMRQMLRFESNFVPRLEHDFHQLCDNDVTQDIIFVSHRFKSGAVRHLGPQEEAHAPNIPISLTPFATESRRFL